MFILQCKNVQMSRTILVKRADTTVIPIVLYGALCHVLAILLLVLPRLHKEALLVPRFQRKKKLIT